MGYGLDVLAPVGGWTVTHKGLYAESGLLSFGLRETRYQGTSYAAAEVTGLAALMLARNRALGQEDLLGSLTDLAQPGWDSMSGYGLINPVAAIRALELQAETPTKSIVVQLLDAASLQERSRHYGKESQILKLAPGVYRLRIWQDKDGNGLWSPDEAFYWMPETLHLGPNSEESKTIELAFLSEPGSN